MMSNITLCFVKRCYILHDPLIALWEEIGNSLDCFDESLHDHLELFLWHFDQVLMISLDSFSFVFLVCMQVNGDNVEYTAAILFTFRE